MTQLLFDASHTSHTRAQTGIQRLCRALHAALRERVGDVLPICHDPYESAWRPLQAWERENMVPTRGALAGMRRARWPWHAIAAGWVRRLLADRGGSSWRPELQGSSFVEPEIFSPAVGLALPGLLARVTGSRVVLFHDATALRLPELSPVKTVARYPAYMQDLLRFDGVAAISEESAAVLSGYWRWLGVDRPPPVIGLPLGIDAPEPSPYGHFIAPNAPLVVLSVGSIEGRKNHVALLDACEMLWARGLRFELRLIGLSHPQTGRAALDRLRTLQIAGRPIHYSGAAPEPLLQEAYRSCAFTVYPSLMEGFGLPVLESLSHGKPCICSAQGALGESARDGGCVMLDRTDAPALAEAISCLLGNSERLAALAEVARQRKFKDWTTYADELLSWMKALPRRH